MVSIFSDSFCATCFLSLSGECLHILWMLFQILWNSLNVTRSLWRGCSDGKNMKGFQVDSAFLRKLCWGWEVWEVRMPFYLTRWWKHWTSEVIATQWLLTDHWNDSRTIGYGKVIHSYDFNWRFGNEKSWSSITSMPHHILHYFACFSSAQPSPYQY